MRTPSPQSCQPCSMAWSWQRWRRCSMSSSAAWTSRALQRHRTSPTRTRHSTASSSSPALSWPKSKSSALWLSNFNWGNAKCLTLGHSSSSFLHAWHVLHRNYKAGASSVVCESLLVSMWPCDELSTCPWCQPAFASTDAVTLSAGQSGYRKWLDGSFCLKSKLPGLQDNRCSCVPYRLPVLPCRNTLEWLWNVSLRAFITNVHLHNQLPWTLCLLALVWVNLAVTGIFTSVSALLWFRPEPS